MAERLRFDTTVLDMDSIQLRDVLKPTVVIFAISTTGQGEMPQNARLLWKTLLSGALRAGSLRKLKFASFGIGDSSYARYNVAHRMLYGRLLQLGAQSFCQRGEGNEQHPEGHSAGFREWVIEVRKKLIETFPLLDSEAPLADDEFLEPKWKLALAEGNEEVERTTNHSQVQANGAADREADVPSSSLLPIKDTHLTTLDTNDRVTTENHFQDVRLLSFHLQTPIPYLPGACAVIYPKNFPSDVQSFIDLMSWNTIADEPLTLHPTTSSPTPSPLRHWDLSATYLTLRWLLENVLDIMSIPRRTLFANLINFASDADEDSAYQKERLLELANPELIDELWDYTTRPKRTILEVMSDFTTIQIPYQYVLSTLPLMKGRQFSIASGGHLREPVDGAEGTQVQLLVAIADPPSPIIKYRRRYGVCTRYIATLKPGQKLSIGMQSGYLDVQPSEMEVPVIMIGPGTGLAPMRAMIWQRLLWARELGLRVPGKALQGDILIFGCRSSKDDFFFREEWEKLREDEGLTVLTAFSRDKEKPREYVQDQIRANAVLLRETIMEKGGKIYISGSSGNMPKGVREALLDILTFEGEKTREEAEGDLDCMEKAGRFKQETW
jgi:sulfite reductase alpha subunit-like flavoprotein